MPGHPCGCDPPIGSCSDCTETPQQFSVTFSGTTIPTQDCNESECEAFFGAYTLEKGFNDNGHCSWGGEFAAGNVDTYDTFAFTYHCDTCTQDYDVEPELYGLKMRLWMPAAGEFRLRVTWSCLGGTGGLQTQAAYPDQWSATITEPFNCETYSDTFTFDSGTNPCGYENVTVLVEGI
jgi:hypothetical protein